ncbi:MAG: efflux RND transporter periplasmic adaptor subunit [Parabacteroides sp.]|nr:efflux RND transporter periplasmic adaptor subunit [Parabacteroides sp.]
MKKIGILTIALGCLAACNPAGKNETAGSGAAVPDVHEEVPAVSGPQTQARQDTVPLPTDAVTGATQLNEVSFNGTLVLPPRRFATVALTMGGIVKNTSLLPGMYVKKGEVLAILENPEFILLQQEYLDSYAQNEYLQAEFIRQQTLAEEEVASQKKWQQARADYHSMKSRLEASSARLKLLGVTPEDLLQSGIRPYLEVKAPLNGYVGNLQMNLGKHLAAGEPLCHIIDKGEMGLLLTAYEKDLGDIAVGNPVEFRVNGLGDTVFRARLVSVGQQVDEVNRSLEVYAQVEQSDPLFRPGIYVTAHIKKTPR